MKVLRTTLLALAALMMLVSGGAATLGLQGRLTQAYLSRMPLVGRFVQAPAADQEGIPEPTLAELQERQRDSEAKESSDLLVGAGAMTLDELAVLASDLQEARRRYDDRRLLLEAEHDALDEQREDLRYRRDVVERLMQDARAELAKLERERQQLFDAQTVIYESEEQNLKKLARLFEAMKAPLAAPRLEKLEDAQVAKLLACMRPRSAAKVLEQLSAERVGAIAGRYRHLIEEQRLKRIAAFRAAAGGAGEGEAAGTGAP